VFYKSEFLIYFWIDNILSGILIIKNPKLAELTSWHRKYGVLIGRTNKLDTKSLYFKR